MAAPVGSEGAPPTVRFARLGDLSALVRTYLGQRVDSPRFYHPFPFAGPVVWMIFFGMIVSRRLGFQRIPRASFVLLVAESPSGGPAGHAYYRVQRAKDGYRSAVVGIQVDPKYQSRHVGSLLLKEIAHVASARGIDVLISTVHPSNERSRRLFERCGYVVSAPVPPPPAGPDAGGEIGYELTLSGAVDNALHVSNGAR